MKPVFITGVERSGSTVIAKIIRGCGAHTGNTSKTMVNRAISGLMDDYYKSIGADSAGQYPLPNIDELPIHMNWRKKIIDACVNDNIPDNGIWLLKSHRLCQTWPLWNFAFPEAKWIIVRRRTGDIIQSCKHTHWMEAYARQDVQKAVNVATEADGWLWWVQQHEKLFVNMITAGLDCKVIWPHRMVNGDFEQIHEMLHWIGLKWKSKIITEVDEMLHKSRMKDENKHTSCQEHN
jgi:hypothetical protein